MKRITAETYRTVACEARVSKYIKDIAKAANEGGLRLDKPYTCHFMDISALIYLGFSVKYVHSTTSTNYVIQAISWEQR